MAGERRKDYMVSKRIHQLYMATWITSLLLVGAFAALVFVLRDLSEQHRELADLKFFGAIHPFVLLGILAFVIVCCSVVLGLYSIVHTHRLMGSAYRIGVVLREANEGRSTRVKLREGDFFTDVGDEVNRMLERQNQLAAPGPAPDAGAAPTAPAS